jgi:hypothetical protein
METRNGNRSARPMRKAIPAAIGMLIACTGATAANDESAVKLSGYVRTWASFNLNDSPETPGDDAGKLSMLRGSLSLTADAKTGPITWKAVGRADREKLTSYEKQLQSMVRAGSPGGPGSDMADIYNQAQLREFYGEGQIGDRFILRLGKQQVSWGETDFFHPTDLIHGFDYRWRSFLEPESDELRKPLILANLTVNVPEADGALQVIVRPGVDAKKDIGNSYMQSGGRWMVQPYKGIDFLASATTYDFDHPSGRAKDVTGGLRWTGRAGPVNYAMSYLKTLYPDPVLNPAANPYRKTPSRSFGDWFYPEIDVFAASISGEVGAIDAVVNGELALQRDRLFNTGSAYPVFMEGTGPVVRKNVIQTTVRVDKQLRLMDALGTNSASLASLQVFDTYIQRFRDSDDIVEAVGFGTRARKHQTIATAFIGLPYMNSRLNFGLAVGRYLQSKDSFVIPSISYAIGNHWRLSAEADLFFAKRERNSIPVQTVPSSLGLLGSHSQLLFRATYQF